MNVAETLKSLGPRERELLSTFTGVLDPWIHDWAKKATASIPRQHLSGNRTRALVSFIGALTGLLEVKSERLPVLYAVLAEKAGDFTSFVQSSLLEGQSSESEIAELCDDWAEKQIQLAQGKIDAGNLSPEAVERLKDEMDFLEGLKRLFAEKWN